MFNKRKGQSATEYLMTYGWAILAIAIVGALLYTQVFSDRACAVEGASGFQLVDAVVVDNNEFAINTTGILSIALKNQVGRNITLTAINDGAGSAVWTGTTTIADGAVETVTASSTLGAGTAGDCYSETVTFVYNTSNQIPLRNTGTLNGRY